MSRKLPDDAFEAYVAMGAQRSYEALARRYGASKRAIAKKASKEGWAERLAKIEQGVRQKSDEGLVDAISEMRARHQQTVKAIGLRALAGLKEHPLHTGMEAVKAAEIAIKLERLLAGEPGERSELAIAEVTRAEIQRLLTTAPLPDPDGGGDQDGTSAPSATQRGTSGEPATDDDW